MKPSALRAGSAPQTNCSAFPATAKHGSLIAFPTEHRHAPARGAAIDSVQHAPSLVSPPLGSAGANRTIFVDPIDKGLAGHQSGRQQNPRPALGLILRSENRMRQRADKNRDAEPEWKIETDGSRH